MKGKKGKKMKEGGLNHNVQRMRSSSEKGKKETGEGNWQ